MASYAQWPRLVIPATEETEVRSEVQGQLGLQSESKTSFAELVRCCLKIKRKRGPGFSSAEYLSGMQKALGSHPH